MQALFWFGALIGHGALWVELVNRSHGLGWRREAIDAITAACGVAVAGLPLGVLSVWTLGGAHLRETTNWAFAGYAQLCWIVLAGVVASRIFYRFDPLKDRRSKVIETETTDLSSRLLEDPTSSSTTRRLVGLPGNQLVELSVEHRELRVSRLPEVCEGLRVAHLTDLHMSGRIGIDYYQELVRISNEWAPDLVCLTGDLVEKKPQLEWIESTLGELRARRGVYYVLGNHDRHLDSDELRRRLDSQNLVDASRQATRLGPREEEILICGDELPWFRRATVPSGEESFTICLAHTPDRFFAATQNGIDLVLAGHCHGGQVRFPLFGPLLCPSLHGVRFASGTFRHGRTVMHVSRGAGGLFPIRCLCRPELALLTLKSD